MRYDERDQYDTSARGRAYNDSQPATAAKPPYPDLGSPADRRRSVPAFAAGAAGAGLGAAAAQEYPRNNGYESPPLSATTRDMKSNPGGIAGAYVPYGDIYGQGNNAAPAHARPISPPSSAGSDRMEPASHRVSSPPTVNGRTYHQNPSAQDGYARGEPAAYDADSEYYDDPRSRSRSRGYYNDDTSSYDRDSYYTEDYRSPSRGYSRDESPSAASYYDHNGRRRSRSERRGGSVTSKSDKAQKLKEKFDMSEDGLKYGALGALAGGLLGNEIGGIGATVLGVAAGALGGSAYEAREKKKAPHRQSGQVVRFDDSHSSGGRPRRHRDESRYYSD